MTRSRNTKALLGLLGAGLAAKALTSVSLAGRDPHEAEASEEMIRRHGFNKALAYMDNPNRAVTEAERVQARRRAFSDNPSIVLTESGYPIQAGDGFLKTQQFKKGGRVSASKRADGIAQRGKTRGRIA